MGFDAVEARTALPVALVGGVRSRAVMDEAIAEGFALVSMLQPPIREPSLPSRLARGGRWGGDESRLALLQSLMAPVERRGDRVQGLLLAAGKAVAPLRLEMEFVFVCFDPLKS